MKFSSETKLCFALFFSFPSSSVCFLTRSTNEQWNFLSLSLSLCLSPESNPISIIIKKSQSYIQKHLYPLSYWYNLFSHYFSIFQITVRLLSSILSFSFTDVLLPPSSFLITLSRALPLSLSLALSRSLSRVHSLDVSISGDNSMYISVGITDINKYIKATYSSVSLALAIYRTNDATTVV